MTLTHVNFSRAAPCAFPWIALRLSRASPRHPYILEQRNSFGKLLPLACLSPRSNVIKVKPGRDYSDLHGRVQEQQPTCSRVTYTRASREKWRDENKKEEAVVKSFCPRGGREKGRQASAFYLVSASPLRDLPCLARKFAPRAGRGEANKPWRFLFLPRGRGWERNISGRNSSIIKINESWFRAKRACATDHSACSSPTGCGMWLPVTRGPELRETARASLAPIATYKFNGFESPSTINIAFHYSYNTTASYISTTIIDSIIVYKFTTSIVMGVINLSLASIDRFASRQYLLLHLYFSPSSLINMTKFINSLSITYLSIFLLFYWKNQRQFALCNIYFFFLRKFIVSFQKLISQNIRQLLIFLF